MILLTLITVDFLFSYEYFSSGTSPSSTGIYFICLTTLSGEGLTSLMILLGGGLTSLTISGGGLTILMIFLGGGLALLSTVAYFSGVAPNVA